MLAAIQCSASAPPPTIQTLFAKNQLSTAFGRMWNPSVTAFLMAHVVGRTVTDFLESDVGATYLLPAIRTLDADERAASLGETQTDLAALVASCSPLEGVESIYEKHTPVLQVLVYLIYRTMGLFAKQCSDLTACDTIRAHAAKDLFAAFFDADPTIIDELHRHGTGVVYGSNSNPYAVNIFVPTAFCNHTFFPCLQVHNGIILHTFIDGAPHLLMAVHGELTPDQITIINSYNLPYWACSSTECKI
jgi:hypothetical protein